jgi:glutamate dehydrogenase
MVVRAEERKQELVKGVAALCQERAGDGRAAALQRFAQQFYAHVPPEDVVSRSREDLYGAALSLWEFAHEREPGTAKIRVLNPRQAEHGWQSPRTIIEIVNDDMPFLVDSVTAALNALDHIVHLVIHPVMRVRRDDAGRVVDLLASDGGDGNGAAEATRESVMHIEISEQSDKSRLETIAAKLDAVLTDVRNAVADWQAMRTTLAGVLLEMATQRPPMPAKDVEEAVDFLKWLAEDNFTFLGYREYDYGATDGPPKIKAKVGLGILRDPNYSVFDGLRQFATLPADIQQALRRPRLLMITKSGKRATVHRPAHMDAIGVKTFNAQGEVTGERLFLGLFTSLAYSRSARTIPLLKQKVQRVMQRAGFAPASHDGKALLHILDTYPRDELFQVTEDELFDIATGILNLQERQRIALFVRRDAFDRFISCLVYVPRDRFNTELRRRMAAILEEAFEGTLAGFQTQLDDSVLARVHFIVRTTRGRVPAIDTAEVERRLVEVGRTWADRLQEALLVARGEEAALGLMRRFGEAFPASYRERTPADEAIADLDRVESVLAGKTLALALIRSARSADGGLGFKIVQTGQPVALSDILPVLENMDLRVLSELPHEIRVAGETRPVWIQEFELSTRSGKPIEVDAARATFEDAFAHIWAGVMESDGFNRLVLLAGLGWRQVVILRTYCKVLRQAGSSFSQAYMEETLARHAGIAQRLVTLFETRFDPARRADVELKTAGLLQEIDHLLDAVTNLDEDRILRSFLLLVQKSLRTNYFQRGADGAPKPYLSVKLKSHELDLLPLPRPLYEVYVYSPRVEGVHLRGGKVARGGIRWSDRKEDFRSEILGLMKAQMVKNSVIVPVGSKGGFVVKRPPAARDAYLAEGIECYKTLMRGLLDITDNIVGGKVVHPKDVVRMDDDDPYLVVAADKGTATFSDIANSVSEEYGYWLGDAFASGGSAGYDHKGMGITARGAWETVKRHFRELGTDIQTTDFACVGVGDMSGDVFGNGMLLSKHIRLIGAFNHLHILVDPDPDPATSWAERKRLFDKPRSQWSDYDATLISKGGGLFERSAKSIQLSPEAKACFGIAQDRLTPSELIQAMLRAEIDLLWFGGIGTYVKSSQESHAEVGDRGNDALRINGGEIRAKVVGEGANLGVTQRGRIDYALKGGRINTDAIDNSAGVDTSDHEVNLKVLLNPLVAAGEIDRAERDRILAAMTDDVAELVLRDNYLQGLALSLAERQGVEILDQQIRLIRTFERAGKLDRAIEFLPDDETLAERAATRQGLTRPELAVLMAYAKNILYDELLPSDLPDDKQLASDLFRYFPKSLLKRFETAIEQHRLRREIIATHVTNSVVNRAGITFLNDMKERSGRPASEVMRAYAVVRGAFELRTLWSAIDDLDNKVPAEIQYDMLLAISGLVERATSWLLRAGLALDIKARLDEFRPGIATLAHHLTELLPAGDAAALAERARALAGRGVPAAVATHIARLDPLVSGFDVVRLARGAKDDVVAAGRAYFAVGARFGLERLRDAAGKLRADTSWQKLALRAIIDDLFAIQAELAAKVLAEPGALEGWLARRSVGLGAIEGALQEIVGSKQLDLAMLTVANRQLRGLAA